MIATGLLVAVPTALAHGVDAGPTGTDGFDALVAALIASAGLAFALGARQLVLRGAWRAAGRRHAAWFGAGLVVVLVALLGPLDAWAPRSFTAHMIQHELLMLVAAPLLVLGRPLAHWAWGLREPLRHALRRGPWPRSARVAWRLATGVIGACALHTAVLWAWHLPAWFRAAQDTPSLHALQHACFLAAALCLWWSVLRPGPARAAAAAGVASLFVTTLTTGALGALLTFAGAPWYAGAGGAPPFGLSALEDQQLGGLIMWIPGGAVYLAVALLLCVRALQPAAPRPRSA
jgi:putative membrane protein